METDREAETETTEQEEKEKKTKTERKTKRRVERHQFTVQRLVSKANAVLVRWERQGFAPPAVCTTRALARRSIRARAAISACASHTLSLLALPHQSSSAPRTSSRAWRLAAVDRRQPRRSWSQQRSFACLLAACRSCCRRACMRACLRYYSMPNIPR